MSCEPASNHLIWAWVRLWRSCIVSRVPTGVVEVAGQRLSGGQLLEARQAHPVRLLDPVVVCGLLEGQRQQPLFFQVRLVDSGEAARDHGGAA